MLFRVHLVLHEIRDENLPVGTVRTKLKTTSKTKKKSEAIYSKAENYRPTEKILVDFNIVCTKEKSQPLHFIIGKFKTVAIKELKRDQEEVMNYKTKNEQHSTFISKFKCKEVLPLGGKTIFIKSSDKKEWSLNLNLCGRVTEEFGCSSSGLVWEVMKKLESSSRKPI